MNGDKGVLWTLEFEHASAHGTECLSFASDAIASKSFLNKTLEKLRGHYTSMCCHHLTNT